MVNFTLTKDTGVTNSFIKILKATEDDIGELIEFGWLKKKNKKLYMHPIIKECVKEQIDTYQPYIIEIMHAYSNREFYKDEYSIFEKSMHFDVMLNILTMIDFCEINNIYVLYNLIEMIKTFRCYESLDNVVGLAVQELEKHEESVEKAKIGADIFNVAGLAYLAYDNNKAMVCFACEEQLIEKYFHDKMRLKAICKGNFALAYIGIDFDIAKEKFKEALEMQIECFGEDSTEVADCYHNIGKNYFENNDYSTAIEYFKLSLKIKREKCRDTYTLLKTELALANAMNFNMNEPYQRSEIETIRELYIAVLEKYSLLQNVIDVEWMYTLHIMADFLNKIGEKESSKRLEELITERRDMS